MNNIPEGYRQIKGIELFFHDFIICSRLLFSFMKYRLKGENDKAQSEYDWLTFFWNCSPKCIYLPINKKKKGDD